MRLAFLVLFAALTAWADSTELSLVDALSGHRVYFEDVSPGKGSSDITILVDIQSGTRVSPIDRELIAKLVQFRFEKAGIPAKVYAGDFRKDFVLGALTPQALLGRKFIVDISVKDSRTSADYALTLGLSFVEYRPGSEGSKTYRLEKRWTKTHQLSAINAPDMEESVSRLIQKEFSRFMEAHLPELLAESLAARSSEPLVAVSRAPYRIDWHDTETDSPIFSLGVTAGLPLIANLHASFWGTKDFPLHLGVSGMYLSDARRGMQLDLGWTIDRSGEFKQVVGLSFARLNETQVESMIVYEGRGRSATKQETFQRLRNSVGPSYLVQWKAFRAQAGILVSLDAQSQVGTRFLFQLGYAPLFFF